MSICPQRAALCSGVSPSLVRMSTFAPRCSSVCTHAVRPLQANSCSAAQPLEFCKYEDECWREPHMSCNETTYNNRRLCGPVLTRAFVSALCSTRRVTIATLPVLCSGVSPSSLAAFASAPLLRSTSTTSVKPASAARCNAVLPSLSMPSMSSPRLSRRLTPATSPSAASSCKVPLVAPCRFFYI